VLTRYSTTNEVDLNYAWKQFFLFLFIVFDRHNFDDTCMTLGNFSHCSFRVNNFGGSGDARGADKVRPRRPLLNLKSWDI
jgi:hypothetical protein